MSNRQKKKPTKTWLHTLSFIFQVKIDKNLKLSGYGQIVSGSEGIFWGGIKNICLRATM